MCESSGGLRLRIGIIGERCNFISFSMLASAVACSGVEVVWFVDAALSAGSYRKLYGNEFQAEGFLNRLCDRLLRLRPVRHSGSAYDCRSYCLSLGIPYLLPKENSVNCGLPEKMYREPQAEFVLIAGCDQILDARGLQLASKKVINYHYSPLPAYRGKNAVVWQWLNREPYIGYTFHEVDLGIDTGCIVFQGKVQYDPEESVGCVSDRVVQESSHNLANLFDCLASGRTVLISEKPEPSFYSSKKFRDLLTVDRSKSVAEVLDVFSRFGYCRLKNGLAITRIVRTSGELAADYHLDKDGITIPLRDGQLKGELNLSLVRYLLNRRKILEEVECEL